ncbi:retinoic acid receptor RXR-gamma-A [Trichonephila clavipes]|uniref:Retinoic acid receptor RXR-gamma-A n=1 Tax=Trichonephila clavipes TaxID=2585209 RepID=A0A8X6V362_TRICX|nr:retinoic acid receptor RXR-gamma-A [Trichonephila clavipes]
MVNRSGPILLHDGALPHVSVGSQQRIQELGYELLPHPFYSLGSASTDYNMFRQLDRFVMDKQFPNQNTLIHEICDFFDQCDAFCHTEVKGLKCAQQIENLREKVYASLEDYCKQNYPDQPGRFAKLLLRLPALRSIGLKCLEHLFFFKLIGDTPIDNFLMSMLEAPIDP